MSCGVPPCSKCTSRGTDGVAFENHFLRTTTGDSIDGKLDGPFLNALGDEIGRVVTGCSARQGYTCAGPVPSEDVSSQNSEEEMMRRLGSWGTFGTIGTQDSIETCLEEPSNYLDDDGNIIDPVLIEKARRKREEARARAGASRAVKFEYPPITSLRQCPRPDPDDLGLLFFTTEELDTYEADRQSAAIVDDVEIVAVSSSASNDVPGPPERGSASNDPFISPSKASIKSFGKYIPTPKSSRGVTLSEQAQDRATDRGRQVPREKGAKGRRRAPTPCPPRHRLHAYDEVDDGENAARPPPSNKHLLKSVQIFLRERSVKA